MPMRESMWEEITTFVVGHCWKEKITSQAEMAKLVQEMCEDVNHKNLSSIVTKTVMNGRCDFFEQLFDIDGNFLKNFPLAANDHSVLRKKVNDSFQRLTKDSNNISQILSVIDGQTYSVCKDLRRITDDKVQATHYKKRKNDWSSLANETFSQCFERDADTTVSLLLIELPYWKDESFSETEESTRMLLTLNPKTAVLISCFTIVAPIVSLFCPCYGKEISFLNVPKNKFIYNLISFAVFLTMFAYVLLFDLATNKKSGRVLGPKLLMIRRMFKDLMYFLIILGEHQQQNKKVLSAVEMQRQCYYLDSERHAKMSKRNWKDCVPLRLHQMEKRMNIFETKILEELKKLRKQNRKSNMTRRFS
ncbi:hypothetical protein DPMN_075467 [Dreissena polymorpha]|uniref:Uncharacterized protein n=1 Tax=Dreissena polymorpha TaxID=45954 RepID=A0A9D4BMJ2_DREPO|nr:hypothetical protein DPMN_075467 [Dreissena polymorpha]